jgi:hypothetical protein
MKALVSLFLAAMFGSGLSPQQQKTSAPTPPALPDNMDCEKIKGDTDLPSNHSTTILKRGTNYYVCRPKSDAVLARAKTAAVVARSTQTISCGDGSSDDCIREDTATEWQVNGLTDKTDLWRYYDKAASSRADLILQFVANNRASSSAQLILQVEDSDTGTWVYYETRTITDIENDVNKLVDHFLLKSGRVPLRTKEEMEKNRQCTVVADQLSALKLEYQSRRKDYDFKNAHPLDAQMDECNLHWKEWVCLKRGGTDGAVSYAKEWNESAEELHRKLSLEYEELKKLEQQISVLSQNACALQ